VFSNPGMIFLNTRPSLIHRLHDSVASPDADVILVQLQQVQRPLDSSATRLVTFWLFEVSAFKVGL